MANTLGSLLVELGLNSAAFVEGLDKATYKAKQAGKEISDSLEGMGESLSKMLAPFGELGAKFGEAFGGIADTLKSVAGEIGGLGGAAGAAAIGVTGLVAAGTAVEGMFVGLALHAAESAGEIQKMSLQTGVSVEQLSKLAFAANAVGVGQEALTRSMQMLETKALASATGTGRLNDMFSRLGIAVKDSNGDLKDSGALFDDVAAKINNLGSQSEKVAIMRQLFGRMGPQLLPLVENMGELQGQAEKLGFVLDKNTAKAAEKFETDLRILGQAATGVGNQLLSELLPVFQVVADYMISGLQEVVKWTKSHSEEIKTVTQYVVSFGGIVYMVFGSLVDLVVDAVKGIAGLEIAVWHLGQGVAHLSWSEMKASAKEAMDAVGHSVSETLGDLGSRWENYQKLVSKTFATQKQAAATEGDKHTRLDLTPKGGASGAGEKDLVAALVEKLQAQAKAELDLASAQERTTAAIMLKKAAEEGEKQVADLRATLQQKELQLVDQIAAANEENNSKQAAALTKKLESIAGYLAKLQNVAPQIVALHEEIAAGGFAGKAEAESNKAVEALQEQSRELDNLASAYQRGGNAVESAKLDEKLKKQSTTINELNDMLVQLRSQYGETDPAVQALEKTLEHENEALATQKFLLNAIDYKDLVVKIAALNQSYSQLADTQKMLAVAQEISKFDTNKQYDDQIRKMEDTRAVMEKLGMDTLQIDAAIFDAQNKMAKQWDDAAIKMGSFKDKIGGILDEVRLNGQNMWGSIAEAANTAVQSMSDGLAKLLVTGKGTFKQIFQSFEESMVKSSINKLEGTVAGGIEKMFGLGPGALGGAKPDGSSESLALWVQIAGQGGASGGVEGAAKSILGIGGQGGDTGESGGFLSGIEGAFSNLFGGFLADGGDVTPGKAYVVGERHPEFFVPRQPGSVAPTLKSGGHTTNSVAIHVHGATNPDSFRKSMPQISAQMHAHLAAASAHAGAE